MTKRFCRVCGCTDDNACDDGNGNGCYWAEWNLCSNCFGKVEKERSRRARPLTATVRDVVTHAKNRPTVPVHIVIDDAMVRRAAEKSRERR